MEVVYHQQTHDFECRVEPLETRLLLDHEKPPPPSVGVPLEINFEIATNVRIVSVYEDGTRMETNVLQPHVSATGTVPNVDALQTREEVDRILSWMPRIGIGADKMDQVVGKIKRGGREAVYLDSKKGRPRALRLKVCIEKQYNWTRCEFCTKDRDREVDAWIKDMLGNARVVAADDEEDTDGQDRDDGEFDDDGPKTKRRRVVRESGEVCSICMEEFVVGSEDGACTPCSHMFHGECIGRWLKRPSHRNCPLCRREITIELEPHENEHLIDEDSLLI